MQCHKKFLLLLGLLFSLNSHLFPEVWNVDSDGVWNQTTNWLPTTVPNSPSATAEFNNIITAPRTVNVNAAFDVHTLSFQSPIAYTLITGPLNMYSQINVSAPDASHIINASIDLQADISVSNVTSSPLTLGGVISGAQQISFTQGTTILTALNTYTGPSILQGTVQISSDNNLGTGGAIEFSNGVLQPTATITTVRDVDLNSNTGTFSPDSAVTYTLNGPGVISGGGVLIKDGDGTVILNGTNTYTGGTQPKKGILQISADANLGGAAGPIVFDGGTLQTTANLTLNRPTTMTGAGTLSPNTTLDFQGVIDGAGALTIEGTGPTTLSGVSTYTGGTNVNNTTIITSANTNLGNDASKLTLSGSTFTTTATYIMNRAVELKNDETFEIGGGTLELTGQISGDGKLIKEGTETLDLGTSSHTYSGGTTLTDGMLQINAPGNLGTGQLEFNGGTLNSAADFTVDVEALLTVNGVINTNTGTNLTWSGIISGGGNLEKTGGGSLVLTKANTYTGTTTVSAGTLQGTTISLARDITNNSNLLFNQNFTGIYSNVTSGTGNVIKAGPGTVIITNTNTYAGNTELNDGTLQLSSTGNLGPGDLVFNLGSLRTTSTRSLANRVTLNGDGIFNIDASTTLDLTKPAPTITGSAILIKIGEGTLDLGPNTSTYSGGTELSEGTLKINVTGNLGTGLVDFDGGTLLSNGNIYVPQNGLFRTASIINTVTGSTLEWDGSLFGSGRLIKNGEGTLILAGNNNHTGGITILDGTLEGTTNGIQGNIINNGILEFNQGFAGTYFGNIIGSGSVDIAAGDLTFTEFNRYSGGTSIAAGASLTGNTHSLQKMIANDGSLIFDQSFDGHFNGVISGPGTLDKSGSAVVVISGTQPLTGLTTINEGTLELNGSFAGDVEVTPNGTFSGANQVVSLENNGTVSIGSGFTVNKVFGTYTQSNTGNLIIKIGDLGQNDVLDVTGSATLDGALNVTLTPGVYQGGETYTFLTASPVIPGFSSASSSTGTGVTVDYLPIGLPTSALLTSDFRGSVLQVPVEDLPFNARQVANYLFCPGFYPESSDLLFVMRELTSLPENTFIKELDQLGPSQFGAIPLVELQNNHLLANALASQAETAYWCSDCRSQKECKTEDNTGVWITPVGQWQQEEGYGEQLGFNTQTYGFILGGSHRLAPWMLLSAGGGYTHTNLGWKENGGRGHWNSLYITPSFGLINKNWQLNILTQFSFNHYKIERKIRFPDIKRSAHSEHHSFGFLTRLDGGYKITFNTIENDYPISLIPTVRLSYLNLFESGYKESGADSINLRVDGKYSAFLQPEFLIKLLREIYLSNVCVSSSFYVGWIANIPLSSPNYTARFAVDESFCKSNFSVRSFNKTTNQLTAGIGFLLKVNEHYRIGLDYEGRYFDGFYVNNTKFHVERKF